MVTVVASLMPVVGWSSWLSTWVVVDTLSTKVVVVGCVAMVNIGGGGCVINTGGGVVVVSCHCRPRHPPRGAGWWWWGRHHCRAPHLARAPRCHSRPRHRLVVMPVPLLVVPLIIVDVLLWHWPWTSRCCRHRRVNAGRVVGSPSIILSLSLCPSLSSLCPVLLLLLPSPSLLSRRCPPHLPPVVVVHD